MDEIDETLRLADGLDLDDGQWIVDALAAEVRRLRGLGATGQLEVTEEWTRLPGTDVEIRLRPPMRSGYVGYRQRWPHPDGEA